MGRTVAVKRPVDLSQVLLLLGGRIQVLLFRSTTIMVLLLIWCIWNTRHVTTNTTSFPARA